jgi:hypothetical protein
MTPASLRMGAPELIGHPPDPLSGPHCTQIPQWTQLMTAASIRCSSNSTAMDCDAAEEDRPPAPSSTKT